MSRIYMINRRRVTFLFSCLIFIIFRLMMMVVMMKRECREDDRVR